MSALDAVPAPARPQGSGAIGLRLSAMMFLHYAVGGLWGPVLGRYLQSGLKFTPGQAGWIMGTAGTIGAFVTPLVAGQIADRHFSTQRLLAILLAVAGVLICLASYQTTFAMWLLLSVACALVSAPTPLLTNSLSFAHMTDPNRQFPRVRIWGTIGWIAPAWIFPAAWLLTNVHLTWMPPFLVGTDRPDVTARLADAIRAAGGLSILYALYCLTLPNTPPRRSAREPWAFLKALRLLRHRSFAVLVGVGVAIAAIHQIYFIQTSQFLPQIGLPEGYVLPAMSLGQIAEIGTMALLGLMLKRLGFRRVLLVGTFAYFLRYAIFGTLSLPLWVIVASQALHGVCFACFFAAASIYVDRIAEPDIRHSAQTAFGFLLAGAPLLAGWLMGRLGTWFADADGRLDYAGFWYTLAGIGLAATLAVAIFFREEPKADRAPAASTS